MRAASLIGIAAMAAVALSACAIEDPVSAGSAGEATDAEFVVRDMRYEPEELTVPAGPVRLNLVNQDIAFHNMIIEEADDLVVAVAWPGMAATGTVALDPGVYTIYCDIPGHREVGMDRTLIVE